MRLSRNRRQVFRKLPLVCPGFLLLIIAACALRPEWQRLAREGDLQEGWLNSGTFEHLWLANDAAGSHLRIYVDGDGTPWIRDNRVAIDPTPVNPVLLRLMHDTSHPAVYLGRPCYFGTATDKGCEAKWWTFERYGRTVVDSMCRAANEISSRLSAESVQLIGYSGGGAIVVGMSECTNRLVGLTTIAGNLDPVSWAEYHDYSPLRSEHFSVPDSVGQVHWQCRDDANVPPSATDDFFKKYPDAERRILDDCTHSSGWEESWPAIIGLSPVGRTQEATGSNFVETWKFPEIALI